MLFQLLLPISTLALLALAAPQTEQNAPAGSSPMGETASGGGSSTSQNHGAQVDLMEDDLSPAVLRNRRDALCHKVEGGREHCTSVQCDPKYGWCAHCSYDLPAEEPEKVENPPMKCHWVRIETGSAASSTRVMLHQLPFFLFATFSPIFIYRLF